MGSNHAFIQGTAGRVATTAYIIRTAPAPHGCRDGKGSISALQPRVGGAPGTQVRTQGHTDSPAGAPPTPPAGAPPLPAARRPLLGAAPPTPEARRPLPERAAHPVGRAAGRRHSRSWSTQKVTRRVGATRAPPRYAYTAAGAYSTTTGR